MISRLLKLKIDFNGLAVILLIAAGLLSYSNSFSVPFQFDGITRIANNPTLNNSLDPLGIRASPQSQNFPIRFISYWSFAVNKSIHGTALFGYHAVNVGLHILNSLLVYWLVILLAQTPAMTGLMRPRTTQITALFAAVLFCVHPIQTQAVTYIYQRFVLLAAYFYLWGICMYLMFRFRGHRGRWFYLMLSGMAACLGMLSKEIVFTLPLMLVMIEAVFFKFKDHPLRTNGALGKTLCALGVLGVVLIIPIIYSFDLSVIFGDRVRLSNDHSVVNVFNYPITQLRVVVTYLRLLFAPYNQTLDYEYPLYENFFELPVIFSAVFLLSILVIAYRQMKVRPLVSFGVFWFFIALLVESSFVPIRHVIFEHRLYLPSVGWTIAVAALMAVLISNRRILIIVMTVWAVGLSYLTFQRNKVWQSPVALWSDVARKAPNQSRSWDNLGAAYLGQRNIPLALKYFQKALELDPTNVATYNNLGMIYFYQDDFSTAENYFDKSISIRPHKAMSYNNFGLLRWKQGRLQEALEYFEKAQVNQPELLQPYLNSGAVLRQMGREPRALIVYEKVLNLYPFNGTAYQMKVQTLIDLGEHKAARNFGLDMARIVKDSESLGQTGVIFAQQGWTTEASILLFKAVDNKPITSSPYQELGKVLANTGQWQAALTIWRKGQQEFPDEQIFSQLIRQAQEIMAGL